MWKSGLGSGGSGYGLLLTWSFWFRKTSGMHDKPIGY
jgi:hypothetical protein